MGSRAHPGLEASSTPSSRWLLATQLATCVALTASGALWVHHESQGRSAFCGQNSGCEAVRTSPLSAFFSESLPLPVVGLIAYLVVLGLSCRVGGSDRPTTDPRGLRLAWHRPELTLFAAAGAGGVLAVPLLAYQAVSLGSYCYLCVIVDLSAIVVAACAFVLARRATARGETATSRLATPAWMTLGVLLASLPIGWQEFVRSDPPVGTGLAARFAPNQVNVIEFADFQCPYCRRMHGVLKEVLEEYGDRVRFQRLHRPLPSHSMAESAARAAICAEGAGHGDAMADQLFSIRLSPTSIEEAAGKLGMDLEQLRRCMTSASTDAILEEHEALLPDGTLQGLPTTFVNSESIVGAATAARLRDAIDRAEHVDSRSAAAPAFLGLWGAAFAFCLYFGRRRPRGDSSR